MELNIEIQNLNAKYNGVIKLARLETASLNAINVYQELEEMRKKYGKLKKAEIHFHTPASHDYELIKNKKYNELTEEEIIKHSVVIGYHSTEQGDLLLRMLSDGKFTDENYRNSISDKILPFQSFKEYLSYMLIAYTLYQNDIEIAVITDHNTIEGFEKLKYALEAYFIKNIKSNALSTQKCIYLYLGVEISCSDHTHVVGIFNGDNLLEVQNLLTLIIHNEELGTIETSLSVLEKIHKTKGIGYIAHVNSYKGIGTGLYKSALFEYANLNVLGLTNLESTSWKKHINSARDLEQFCYFHESDAHCLEDLGVKNTWIKMNEVNFNSLNKAIHNHNFCVYTVAPQTTNKFIKGIVLQPSEKSFLKGTGQNPNFILDLSKDLNCIIGGRGTGKSTILNILDTAFTLESNDLSVLKLISQYEFIFIVFRLENKDYILRCLPQVDLELEPSHPDFFLSKAFVAAGTPQLQVFKLSDNWVNLFEVVNSEKTVEIKDIGQRNVILNKIYKKHYSINSIVNNIQSKQSGVFVKNIIFSNMTDDNFYNELQHLKNISRSGFNAALKKSLTAFEKTIQVYNDEIHKNLDKYNSLHKNLINIIKSPNATVTFDYVDELISGISKKKKIANTMFTWEDFADYAHYFAKNIGIITFLRLLFNRNFEELENIQPIGKFVSNKISVHDIEEDIKSFNDIPVKDVFKEILNTLRDNRANVISCLKNYLDLIDDYALLFNVNSKETTENLPTLFKNIEELSLGQQVVAILTFIMSYGKFIGDNSPFIIDQPEDNLDNQYIYKNLVRSLQELKNSRQVIIVTHNSTIVTNADAEQVIVLDSENNRGYIKKTGYLSDMQIMRLILVHLEGGEEAFRRKGLSYRSIISNLS